MRRFITSALMAFLLVICAAGAAPAAHAADDCVGKTFYDAFGTCYATQAEASVADTKNEKAAAAATPAPAQGSNTVLDPKIDDADKFGTIMTWIMTLFAWLVGVAALTLDAAVYHTVVTMGGYVSKLSAVGLAWRILRDVANIMLIFGFVAIGISIILNTEWYGSWKKTLPMLLIAAVFLNFSLFFAEAVIDTSNLFATQFYKQINGGALPTHSGSGITGLALNGKDLSTENEPISNAIMGQIGLQGLYSQARTGTLNLKGGNIWLIAFMGIILFIITAFVMFSLAFILIARFVVLIFLVITAPVGFVGVAVPKLKNLADKWWGELFDQAVTAPALLLLLYIALAVITDKQFLSGGGSGGDWTSFTNPTQTTLAGFASLMLSFLVAMGLLLAVVVFAKKLGAAGAGGATKLAGKLSFGVAGWAGTKAIGLPSRYLAQKVKTGGLNGTRTGRVLSGVLDRGAKATFDVRGTKLLSGFPGGGIDAGKVAEGGYQGQRDRALKGHEDYVKSVDKALEERGVKKEDEEKIAATKLKSEGANAALTTAKKERATLDQEHAKHEAEVKRLEGVVANYGKTTPEGIKGAADLKAAQSSLKTSQDNLTASDAKIDQFVASSKTADAEHAEANKATVAEQKKAMKTAYAGRLDTKNPAGWVTNLLLYGPGSSAAAKKIRDSMKEKTAGEKALDALKKFNEEEAKKTPPAAAPATPPAGGATPAPHP